MPTYEYECLSCCHRFEKLQAINEKPAKKCPKCGKKVKKLISKNVNFIFKGSGFYSTDYKKKGDVKRQKEDKEVKSEKKESEKNSLPEKTEKKAEDKKQGDTQKK